MYLKVHKEPSSATVEATDNVADATSFFIVRLDEGRYFSIVYEVSHESDQTLKEKIEKECGRHKPAISLYLSVPVDWRGKGHKKKPLQIKMSGKRFLTRMALQTRRSKHFQPEKLNDWTSRGEAFFIHCSKYSASASTKGSYLCVHRKEAIVTTDGDKSDKNEKVELKPDDQISKSSRDRVDQSAESALTLHKMDDTQVDTKTTYFTGCEPNIKKHSDPNTFMLFRLLKPDAHEGRVTINSRYIQAKQITLG